MNGGNGLAEAWELTTVSDGFRILGVTESSDELVIMVETTTTMVDCGRCGARAEAHDRDQVDIRDLACSGQPVRLRVSKRRWSVPTGTVM